MRRKPIAKIKLLCSANAYPPIFDPSQATDIAAINRVTITIQESSHWILTRNASTKKNMIRIGIVLLPRVKI